MYSTLNCELELGISAKKHTTTESVASKVTTGWFAILRKFHFIPESPIVQTIQFSWERFQENQ